jgi:hypothetical protein
VKLENAVRQDERVPVLLLLLLQNKVIQVSYCKFNELLRSWVAWDFDNGLEGLKQEKSLLCKELTASIETTS